MDIEILKRPNFIPSEFFKSKTAEENNIDNLPNNIETIENLSVLADTLQAIRDFLSHQSGHDCPINIHCAFRNVALNKLVGGKPNSQHLEGCAADFDCEAFGNLAAVFFAIRRSNIIYDQLLLEPNCIHISVVSPVSKNRKMAGKYAKGIFTKM